MVEEEDWAFGHGHVEFAMPLRHHVQISVEQRGKGVPSLGGRCVSHQRPASSVQLVEETSCVLRSFRTNV